MKTQSQNLLTRVTVSALFIAVMAGSWDAWWHSAMGRESFWSPPHLLLYTAVIVAIASGLYGWRKTREKVWRRLAIILALIPLSAPIDDLWHRIFGVENIASPLIVWSPPHLLLIGAVIASFAALLPLLRRDGDLTAQRFFGGLSFAGILTLLLFTTTPLEPTGPYALAGFWGAGFMVFIITAGFLLASLWMPGFADTTLVAAFLLVITRINSVGDKMSPDVVIKPHDHPPAWLIVFSVLIFAIIVDVTKKQPLWLRGGLGALAWSALIYGFSSMFFKPEFQYTLLDAAQAVAASLAGGLAAGLFLFLALKSFYPKLLKNKV